jgi:hypothetical protein
MPSPENLAKLRYGQQRASVDAKCVFSLSPACLCRSAFTGCRICAVARVDVRLCLLFGTPRALPDDIVLAPLRFADFARPFSLSASLA